MTGEVVVVDLDNTLVHLEVDWDALRGRLAELAERAEVLVERHGIWPLMEAARQPGREPLLAEMEQVVTEAELEGARGPCNQALVEWLDKNAAGTPLSVLSLNSRRAVQLALETHGLADRVAHVVGREDVRRVKPDPEGMLILAERHGVKPEAILFVGDKDGDRECAEAAGTRFLHVEEVGVDWQRASSAP
ncbi:MAG: phosphoglycolate phosphatase [Thermoleophilaceae bacterium]|jgi:phosphoglycolate phosphatase|nr:phosphoglycolate phosphatase [Thermoleophilaceae bacterium]MEA2436622.1 phosphoglycolate phosphatase [Thermoleophilaceae bacterium]